LAWIVSPARKWPRFTQALTLNGFLDTRDLAVADYRPAGLVGYLGGYLVAVVLVTVERLGQGRVDFNLDLSLLVDLHLSLCHDLRLLRRTPVRVPPDMGIGTRGAPLVPVGVPDIVVDVPPVTGTVQPVPAADGIPSRIVVVSQDLVLDLRVCNGRPEVILCGHQRLEFFTKLDRILRGIDLNLELRFLVFLDAESPAAPVAVALSQVDTVDAERGVGRKLDLSVKTAEIVGLKRFFVDLFTLGIVDSNIKLLACKLALALDVILRAVDPRLELDLVLGPVYGPVGHHEALYRLVLGIVVITHPDARESQVCEASFLGPGGQQPGVIVGDPCLVRLYLSIFVGELGEVFRMNVIPPVSLSLAKVLHPVSEELDVGLFNRLARYGIGEEIPGLVNDVFLYDDGIRHPDQDLAGVAGFGLCRQEICSRFLQGGSDRNPPVPVCCAGLEVHRP